MTRVFSIVIMFILHSIFYVNCANILVLLSFPPPSHHLWNEKIINKLADRGHNVTVLSVVKPKSAPKNVHYIHLDKIMELMQQKFSFKLCDLTTATHSRLIEMLYEYLYITCEGSLMSEGFSAVQNYPDDFKVDLVIHDINAGPCLLGLLQKFRNPPLVGISAYKYTPEISEILGSHYFASYMPIPSMTFEGDMTFFQRLENMYYIAIDYIYRHYILIPKREKLARAFYKYPLPSLQSLEQRTTVTLFNLHPAIDSAISFGPNVIQVGGLEVDEPKPLPADLEHFILSAKDGVVLISFGTNVDTEMFSAENQRIVIEMVKKFPNLNFIWKFEKDISEGRIPNLMVTKWLPQNDILAHPKLKLFISHGGGLSTNEATWHGVPMVTIPFFLDQIQNSRKSAAAGVSVTLDVHALTLEKLDNAIRSVLKNSSYSERMRIRSSRFRDRPQPPMETAMWWIEYILRHPDPEHLRSTVLHTPFWEIHSYDIFIFCLVIVISLSCFIYYLFKRTCRIFIFNGDKKAKLQ